MDYSGKKPNRGFEDIFFWTPVLEILGFLLYHWKFQTQQSFPPINSTNFLDHFWKFHVVFNLPLEVPELLFLQYPYEFHILTDVIQALFDDVISHGALMTTFSTNPYFFIFQRFECYTTFIFRELLYNRNQFFFLLLLFQKVS